jgi:hypothetical protein
MWTVTAPNCDTAKLGTFDEARTLAIATARKTKKSVLVKRTPRS